MDAKNVFSKSKVPFGVVKGLFCSQKFSIGAKKSKAGQNSWFRDKRELSKTERLFGVKRALSKPESFQSWKGPFGAKKAHLIPDGPIEDKRLLYKPKNGPWRSK